jgi:hypothetical protein
MACSNHQRDLEELIKEIEEEELSKDNVSLRIKNGPVCAPKDTL